MRLFLCIMFAILYSCVSAQTVQEILYYDKNGKGVASSDFAEFVATFVYPDDPNYEKQFVVKKLKTDQVIVEGTFYYADKYELIKSYKSYRSYYDNGNLYIEHIGDSLDYTYKKYFSNGKLRQQTTYKNGKPDGKSYGLSEDEDIMTVIYYQNGVPKDTFDYYYNGVHTQYTLSDYHPVLSNVTIEDRQLIKNKSGEQWYKYEKNGLIVQARAVESKEYGKFWTIQLSISNYSRNYIDIKVANMHGLGIKKDKAFDLKFIPADVYFKKVVKKQNRRMFAARLFGAVADNMSATSHAYTSGRVGKTTYNAHTSYFDSYAYERASERTNARLNEYNDALLDEREELAENYITDCAVNPGESIVGFVNYEHKSIDYLGFTLVIDGIEYEYSWHTN